MVSTVSEEPHTTEKEIQILHLEDDKKDAELIQAILDAAGIATQITCIQSASEFSEALSKEGYELILADYRLPAYDGMSALRFSRENYPNIPFIFVSGTLGEDAAIEGLTQGATDYVLKHKLARLVPAVQRALDEAENRRKRKQIEQELIEREREFRTLAENSPDNIARYDSNYRTLYVNPSLEKTLGCPASEILGTTPVEAALIDEAREYQEKIVEVFKTGKDDEMDLVLPDRCEGVRYHNVRFVAELGPEGSVTGVQTIGRDITERIHTENALRESEQKFRSFVEESSEGFTLVDEQGCIIEWNRARERMTGIKADQVVGKFLWDIMHQMMPPEQQTPENYERNKKTILDALETGQSPIFYRVIDAEVMRQDGERQFVQQTVFPIKIDKGYRIGSVTSNITERKQHEREREAIITVSNSLRQATTRTEIISVILDQLVNLFEANGAVLVLSDPQTGGFIAEMGNGAVGERMIGLNIPPGKGICNWVITHKEPYLNNHVDQDAHFYRPDLLGASHCLIAAPLIAQGQALGALWVARKMSFVEQDLRLLMAIADIAANAIHRVTLHEQTEQQLHRLMALHQIDLAISTSFDLHITLNVLLSHVKDELEVDAVCILLLDPVTYTLDYAAGIGFRTNNIERSQVRIGSGCAGCAAQEHRTVSCLEIGEGGGVFIRSTLLVDEDFISHYATPLMVKGQVKGVLEFFHRKTLQPEHTWLSFFETLATQAAIAIENASLFENMQRSNTELTLAYDATIEGWSRALDLRDKETEGHTQRVTKMTLMLAKKMGMSATEKLDLRRGALLHDIGKMGIPDEILHKPGSLSNEEWEIMRQHPLYAYQMLSPIAYLKRALEIPYCHHEKWDGSGYPQGLKGEQIPIAARLFAVVDVWDALTSNRPYRSAWSKKEALEYIHEQAGKQFDPRVVELFLQEIKAGI